MNITLDERGCGQGKTTDGIYKRIYNNHKNNIKSLVVVPNLDLQSQYQKDLDIPVHIINSTLYNQYNNTTTVKATRNSMEQGLSPIIITHQTFVKLPMYSYRKYYDLIIDEAIEDVIRYTEVKAPDNEVWNPKYDLENLFEFVDSQADDIIKEMPTEDQVWFELHQTHYPEYGLLAESKTFKEITDRNYIHYVTAKGWNVLNNQDGGSSKVISVLNRNIFNGYRSVHIAAAAFKHTKMYHWMKANSIFTQTQNSFKKHKGNIKIWASDKNNFRYTGYKRKNLPQIMDRFHSFVNEHSTGKVIAIRNNDESRKLSNEERVGHNVHGLNKKDLQSCTNISLESALLFNPIMEKFIVEHWLFDSHNKYEIRRKLIHMHSAYNFYQVIMRTKLRNKDYDGEQINIFVPDQDTAVCLMEYFSEESMEAGEMHIITDEELLSVKNGRPRKSEAEKKLKKQENNRRNYLLRKEKFSDKPF